MRTKINIPCSFGELVDKITILEIKREKIQDQSKLAHIKKELSELKNILNLCSARSEIEFERGQLKIINSHLWSVEDKLRELEKKQTFNQNFIELARKVYIFNDQRAGIKKSINLKTNSELIEEKSYESY